MKNAPSQNPSAIPLLSSIAPLAHGTRAWLVDIWGVMHNGVVPFFDACNACKAFRDSGGVVVLVSNSPRPNDSVAAQLDAIGVPRDCWDAIVTSGDVARTLIAGYRGRPVLHIGPQRDLPTLAGLDLQLVDADAAEAIVCTGLHDDESETPADYAELLARCHDRDLSMVCANPDLRVERGGRIIYCAGAVARAYGDIGGRVDYAGKPYMPIYDLTFATLEKLKPGSSDRSGLLAIGDGIGTDIAGATTAGIPAVFIASGVHVDGVLDAAAMARLFPEGASRPVAAMTGLAP